MNLGEKYNFVFEEKETFIFLFLEENKNWKKNHILFLEVNGPIPLKMKSHSIFYKKSKGLAKFEF